MISQRVLPCAVNGRGVLSRARRADMQTWWEEEVIIVAWSAIITMDAFFSLTCRCSRIEKGYVLPWFDFTQSSPLDRNNLLVRANGKDHR